MRPKLQGTVIPVLEQCFLVDAQEFFHLLGGDPARMLSHKETDVYSYTLWRERVLSMDLSKISCVWLAVLKLE